MKTLKNLIFIVLFTMMTTFSFAHDEHNGNITGEVIDANGKHIPFATVQIVGTTIGTTTDATGHYLLIGVHSKDKPYQIKAQSVGYKSQIIETIVKSKVTSEVNFKLDSDILGLEEVVVTGNRTVRNRKEASVIVNTISPKLFQMTQSTTFGEGLNFSPGLRMENDCQNCGFSQVRMNGMEGPYSQILINSRPIFSGLAGVYGLELIPANMIEKVEVVRGGGSALYGSNAIAGTINVILKDPIANTYEAGVDASFSGIGVDEKDKISSDYSVHMNTSLISDDKKTGLAVYGFMRDREPFDANNDKFSELSKIKNMTVGTRLFHRLGARNKLTADFFSIKEQRRGGDKFDNIEHEAGIAESLKHQIITGALGYDQFFREKDLWSVYVSGQKVDRDSYYGAEQSLKDYGKTTDFTYTIGTQYTWHMNNAGELSVGTEHVASALEDKKLGYADVENAKIEKVQDANGNLVDQVVVPHTKNVIISDQKLATTGVFAQYEIKWEKLTASAGVRYDHYSVVDDLGVAEDKTGDVFNPRLTLKYSITDFLQVRTSYSQGYRAPQIFDEDLHIETSGAKKIIHKNDPGLKQETSQSYMASLDFNKTIGNTVVNFLVEGFYTKLDDAFADKRSDPDANGVVTHTRVNAKKGAEIKGLNMELNIVPSAKFMLTGGFTLQTSEYKEAQEDYENTNFLRTPDNYGYFAATWTPANNFGLALTGNYTGAMDVPYEGGLKFKNTAEENLFKSRQNADGEGGWVLRKSDSFFDLGLKINYDIKINSSKLRLFGGMKNIFNSYQSDFDRGINRDPAYIYGPLNPRTIYFGIKIGNNLR